MKIVNEHEPKILHLPRILIHHLALHSSTIHAKQPPHQNRTARQRPQIPHRGRRAQPQPAQPAPHAHRQQRHRYLARNPDDRRARHARQPDLPPPRHSSATRTSMESCRLLVRWNSRIREWAPYCLRLRSSSTVLCSSSARLGSARRVSGLRSGRYSVCSAAPVP